MKNIVLFIVLLLPYMVKAQDITGIYSPLKRSGDPQGGSMFFITPDNHWGAMAFGTALYGTVQYNQDSTYSFAQLKPATPFSIYSRYNPELGDSTRMFFSDFSSGQYFVHFDGNDEKAKPYLVYNIGANCYSYPSLAKLVGIKNNISIGLDKNHGDKKINPTFYNFSNRQKHNDFIIINNAKVFYAKDKIMIIKDSLLFEAYSSRSGYKLRSKDMNKIEEYAEYLSFNISFPDTLYANDSYNILSQNDFNKKDWDFKKSSDCYVEKGINKMPLQEKKAPDYNDVSVVYPFRLIKEYQKKEMELAEKPSRSLLYSSCDD